MTDEQNDLGRRRVNETDWKKLDKIVQCQHGEDPKNKKRLLAEQRAKVGAAALRRSEMDRCHEQDRQKYDWLSGIIRNELGRRASFMDKYESFYGPLIPNETHESNGDDRRAKRSTTSPEFKSMMQRRSQRGLSTLHLVIAMLILCCYILAAYCLIFH